MRTMNSNTTITVTRPSLRTWFDLRNISVDTLHKGDTEDDEDNVYYYYYYYYFYRHLISHFSALAGKHSTINSNRFDGLFCNLKSFLQLNIFQELQIFAFVCTYWDAGYVFLDFAVVNLGLLP